jgi:hypothetical protein
VVWAAGFDYVPDQDIIISRMDALQRSLGYCWAYDIAAPALGMIIDAEPLYFTYEGSLTARTRSTSCSCTKQPRGPTALSGR